MLPISPSLVAGLHAYAAPLLSLSIAGVGAVLCRDKRRRGLLPALAAGAVLAGWAALSPPASVLRAAWWPRTGPDLLLAPAVAGVMLMLAAAWRRGWLERWGPAILAAASGWWLARSPGGQAEFWRVWFVAGLLAWLLAKAAAGQPARGLAGGLALWGGLILAGSSPAWVAAAAVAAGAWVGLLAAGAGAVLPAALMAAVIVGADLAAGRAMRGSLNLADLAGLAACGAPVLAEAVRTRIAKRAGKAAPVLGAIIAAAITVGLAWLVHRAARR
ncbi:MAG: hypothetical protein NVSMB18_23840 [Acetobacteraceae bacterium]